MRKSFLAIVYFSFALLLILVVSHASAEIPDIVLKQKNTAVTIRVSDKNGKHVASGGGFIIDQNGVIVTNCQVIVKWFEEVQNTLKAEIEGGIHLPIEDLISSKCENNLALFKVEAKGLPAVKLAADYKAKQGESIVVIGGPSEFETIILDGVIKSIRGKNRLIQFSIPVAPEMSGSPVFNIQGKVIGAVTFLPKKGKNLNVAVPLKNVAEQLSIYRKLAKIDEPPPITILDQKPLDERKTKYYDAKKEAEEKPDDANAYFLRGYAYYELNMYKEAIKLYKQSLEIKPDFVEAYINLGVAYYKLGKYADTIEAYNQAIRIRPSSILVYNKLGTAYIIEGAYSMARETFKKVIDIDTNNAEAHYNLGIAYFLNGDTTAAFGEYLILKDIDKERANSLIDLIY